MYYVCHIICSRLHPRKPTLWLACGTVQSHYVGHVAVHDDALSLIISVGVGVNDQQQGAATCCLDLRDDVIVRLVLDVRAADLNDAVTLLQAGHVRRRALFHLADIFAGLALYALHVEAITIVIWPGLKLDETRFVGMVIF